VNHRWYIPALEGLRLYVIIAYDIQRNDVREKLGVYYGVTVYALYPSRSMLEDSLGLEQQFYVNNLADWLAKGILSSQSLYKTLISAEPLLLPGVRSGTGRKGWKYSLPARILDDYMVCRTRAWYTAHPIGSKPRRIQDMEDSEKRGSAFIGHYLIPKLEEHFRSTDRGYIDIVDKVDCNKENRIYYLEISGLEREVGCKPDSLLVLSLHGILRLLVIEVADTNVQTILSKNT